MIAYGRDGYHLLDQVYGPSAPDWLGQIPAVEVLRRIWIQQFYRDVDTATGRAQVRRREAAPDGDGLPPGHLRIVSPYDLDARYSIKRDTRWSGYKVHFTETCDAAPPPATDGDGDGRRPQWGEAPNLITNVATTTATVPDVAMTAPIHQQLAAKNLTPVEHLVDSGYPSADIIVAAARLHGITLVSPMLLDHSAQARAGAGYDQASFTIDFDNQRATCPQGATSSSWSPASQRGTDTIVVSWPTTTCKPCPAKTLCTKGSRRHLSIRPREEHQALADARAWQTTGEWKTTYAARAGVEGTMRQTTHVTGIRTTRYRGLPKTTLEHTIAATAINLIRLDAYWTGHPLDRTRTSHLTRLDFTTVSLIRINHQGLGGP
jgi:IS5 family transposase